MTPPWIKGIMKGIMNELALFAGAGGGILGGKLLGWRTICAVEIERHARRVLLARQNDGILEPFPVWDDVRTFDGKPWRGLIDVVSGGFPCQDISVARAMWGRDGLRGAKSGLWREMFRIIAEVRPPYVFGENSPVLRINGLADIVSELACIGYDCRWVTIGADSVGLNHKRRRLWLYASDANSERLERYAGNEPHSQGRERPTGSPTDAAFLSCAFCGYIFDERCGRYGCSNCEAKGPGSNFDYGTGVLPRIAGMGHGLANRVERIKAIGNGQVPAVAALAWRLLMSAPDNQGISE